MLSLQTRAQLDRSPCHVIHDNVVPSTRPGHGVLDYHQRGLVIGTKGKSPKGMAELLTPMEEIATKAVAI